MLLLLLVSFLLLHTKCTTAQEENSTRTKTTFYLPGLFPVDSSDARTRIDLGIFTRAAAAMAVEHVNRLDFNFRMEFVPFNSGCDKASSANGLGEIIQFLKDNVEFEGSFADANPTLSYAILGPACNYPTLLIASLTGRYLKTVQMSYAADAPQLSNLKKHPLFFQSVPSYTTYQDSIYATMRAFDWLQVGVVHEVVPFYTVALEKFVKRLQQQQDPMDAQVIATQGFEAHLLLTERLDARIIIGMVREIDASNMLCAAYHSGSIGPSYQWILLGDFQEDWWESQRSLKRKFNHRRKCTRDEMMEAVESVLILTHKQKTMEEDVETVSGRTVEEFWDEYMQRLNRSRSARIANRFDGAMKAPSTYDAVWSIALAVNETMSRSKNETPFAFALKESLERLNFTGVSGKIRFSPQSHHQLPPTTVISQMQDGVMVQIGIHDTETDTVNLSYFGNELVWKGSAPPRDRPQLQNQHVSIWLVGIMLIATAIGLLFALAMIIVNIHYRKHKVIKASSPYINIIIIIGCVLGFCSVIVMSIESIDTNQNISLRAYSFICNVRPWLLSCGFTLAFGALFAKTWRVYVIFRNPWRKNRPYKDYVLIGMVGVFLLFDVILLVLWAVINPLVLFIEDVDLDQENFIHEKYVVCAPSNGLGGIFAIWIGVVSLPKGVLLLFGTFLVTQTSRIKTKFFNDARYTAIAIYGVVIGCLTGMPTAILFLYKYEEDWGYADASSVILGCCYLILIMVFVPKLILLKRYKNRIPTAVLLNINPSFRIRKYRTFKDRSVSMRRQHSMVDSQSPSPSPVHSENGSDLESLERNSCSMHLYEDDPHQEEGVVDVATLQDWEAAKEEKEDSHEECETYGEEVVKYGDFSYIAYVAYRLEDPDKPSPEHGTEATCPCRTDGGVGGRGNTVCKVNTYKGKKRTLRWLV